MSGPNWDEPQQAGEMTPEAVTYYKRMAAAHADDPVTGRCPKCGTRRCMDYVTAVLKLGDAGYRVDER